MVLLQHHRSQNNRRDIWINPREQRLEPGTSRASINKSQISAAVLVQLNDAKLAGRGSASSQIDK